MEDCALGRNKHMDDNRRYYTYRSTQAYSIFELRDNMMHLCMCNYVHMHVVHTLARNFSRVSYALSHSLAFDCCNLTTNAALPSIEAIQEQSEMVLGKIIMFT